MGNGQRRTELRLRCFGYPGTNNGEKGVFGHCLDLNLTVWRRTSLQAIDALNEQIQGNIEASAEIAESQDEFEELLYRPAPIRVQLRYFYISVIFMIPRISKTSKDFFIIESDRTVPKLRAGNKEDTNSFH